MSAQPIFESALRALHLAHDGTPPRHEYLAALAADRAGTPEPHDDDAAGYEARAAEEEQGARKCAELIGRDMQTELTAKETPPADPVAAGKHTPGPWRAEPAITKAGRKTLCIGAPSRRLFDMRAWDDEDYANARLIVAAPDMLAALQYWLGNVDPDGRFAPHWHKEAIRLSRAAIARATGGGG